MRNLSAAYNSLLEAAGHSFIVQKDGQISSYDEEPYTNMRLDVMRLHVVPGSFDPLHESHKELFDQIVVTDSSADEYRFFEISIERVDKDMITLPQLGERLKQFEGYAPVIVTRAPRFIEKIGLLLQYANKLQFHVGIDTIIRMRDDYGTLGIQGLASRFTVYDRILNGEHKDLSTEFGNRVPRNCFPAQLQRSEASLKRSSTEIREEMGG